MRINTAQSKAYLQVGAASLALAATLGLGLMPSSGFAAVQGSDMPIGSTAVFSDYSVTVDSAERSSGQLTVTVTMTASDGSATFAARYLDGVTTEGSTVSYGYGPSDTRLSAGETKTFTLVYDDPDNQIAYLSWDNWSNEESWALEGVEPRESADEGSVSGAFSSSVPESSSGTVTTAQLPEPTETQLEGLLTTYFFDVGQGDCSLLVMPDGSIMLVDAGPAEAVNSVTQYVQALGYWRIDRLVLTGADSDRIGGAQAIMDAFEIGEILATSDALAGGVNEAAVAKGVSTSELTEGERIFEACGCTVDVVACEGDAGAVLLVNHGSCPMLFCGDASRSTLEKLPLAHVDVLKVSDHGSSEGTSTRLVSSLSPAFSIVSVGSGNAPDSKTLSALEDTTMWRTDMDGVVVAQTDGANTWMSNDRWETTTATQAREEALENATMGMNNALRSAQSYLRFSNFSYQGLYDQLQFEGYTDEECRFAVDYVEADWYEQAVGSAKSYLSFTHFSWSGLVDQLEFEGFTYDQAVYGANNCGADWYEQAAGSAQDYLDFMSFSRDGLVDQLMFEGFSYEEAEYGVTAVGY